MTLTHIDHDEPALILQILSRSYVTYFHSHWQNIYFELVYLLYV